jgi:hypothetical protein
MKQPKNALPKLFKKWTYQLNLLQEKNEVMVLEFYLRIAAAESSDKRCHESSPSRRCPITTKIGFLNSMPLQFSDLFRFAGQTQQPNISITYQENTYIP